MASAIAASESACDIPQIPLLLRIRINFRDSWQEESRGHPVNPGRNLWSDANSRVTHEIRSTFLQRVNRHLDRLLRLLQIRVRQRQRRI